MKKRLFSVIILTLMIIATVTPAFAATEEETQYAKKVLDQIVIDQQQLQKGVFQFTFPKVPEESFMVKFFHGNHLIYFGTGGNTIKEPFDPTTKDTFVLSVNDEEGGQIFERRIYIWDLDKKKLTERDFWEYVEEVNNEENNKNDQSQEPSTSNPFSDISTHWAKDYILELYQQNFIQGYPDGSFGPEHNVTRAEFMAILNRIAKEKYEHTPKHRNTETPLKLFIDFNAKHWAYTEVGGVVQHMSSKSIIETFGHQFTPDTAITREEVAAVIYELLADYKDFQPGDTGADYSDLNDSRFPDALRFAVTNGILQGYEDQTLRPQRNITRAEIATIFVRILPKL